MRRGLWQSVPHVLVKVTLESTNCFCVPSLTAKQVLSVHPGPLPEDHTKKDKSGSECDMCITVVEYVYSQLKNESTEV